MGAQVAKIAQVVGENQNFEGLKNAIQILIFVCRYMFLFLFAAILQKCASGCSGKHNFANCIFDAKSVGSDFGRSSGAKVICFAERNAFQGAMRHSWGGGFECWIGRVISAVGRI